MVTLVPAKPKFLISPHSGFAHCGAASIDAVFSRNSHEQQGDPVAARAKYDVPVVVSGKEILIVTGIAACRLLGPLAPLAFCRKTGFWPELAWTCCDYADMLRERDAEGERAKAMALLDESPAISSELGVEGAEVDRPVSVVLGHQSHRLPTQGFAHVDCPFIPLAKPTLAKGPDWDWVIEIKAAPS